MAWLHDFVAPRRRPPSSLRARVCGHSLLVSCATQTCAKVSSRAISQQRHVLTHPSQPMAAAAAGKRRVGVVGYGALGQYLVNAIVNDEVASSELELAFVWNRTPEKVAESELVPAECRLTDLADFARFGADLIVEVAHPSITRDFGPQFAASADYFVGSPTAFADAAVEASVREAAAVTNGHGVYVPSGALWGAQDIQKMASRGTLTALTVCMKKHPSSLKVEGELVPKLERLLKEGTKGEAVVYEGPVRGLCPLAPNNVNTMAAAALAGHTLGFDGTVARLVADDTLEAHVITIDVAGGSAGFKVSTERYNPAKVGAVTGSATYASFLSSMLLASGRGDGLHLV